MLRRNDKPIYLPFIQHSDLVHIGASRIDSTRWIDIDSDFGVYHQNKLKQYSANKDRVFLASSASLAAQQELHTVLLAHLCNDHHEVYQQRDNGLHAETLKQHWQVNRDSAQPLWDCSLWVQPWGI